MKHGSRILVVDDNQDIVNMLRVALSRHGFEIDTTTSPEEALAMASTRAYDAALLDLVMPERDGAALARDLREKNPGLPVALLTAHGTVDSAVEAVKLGAFDYLEKPRPGSIVHPDWTGGRR